MGCFLATFEKTAPTTALGLHCDLPDGQNLYVCNILDSGLVPLYNETAPEELRIKGGDYIRGVNDVTGNSRMMQEELKTSEAVQLLLQRQTVFTCRIVRYGRTLGLGLSYGAYGESLLIVEIGEGVVKDRYPEILLGDRITTVNSVGGTAEKLLHIFKEADSEDHLELQLSRCTRRD